MNVSNADRRDPRFAVFLVNTSAASMDSIVGRRRATAIGASRRTSVTISDGMTVRRRTVEKADGSAIVARDLGSLMTMSSSVLECREAALSRYNHSTRASRSILLAVIVAKLSSGPCPSSYRSQGLSSFTSLTQ